MELQQLFLCCTIAAASSAVVIYLLGFYATTLGLVDKPSERKKHVGNIPLIGGLAAFAGVLSGAWFAGQSHMFGNSLLATAAMLALLGALDDRFDLSVRSRLLVQTTAVLVMVSCTGVYIHTLGHLFGHELELGMFGIPLTVVAVIGLLNAFNMMDGIDGLAGTLALVSVGAIAVYQGMSNWSSVLVLLLLAAALLPYLAVNLGLLGRKIFLGDAGSMVVGYLLAWTLIRLSQESTPRLSTIDVLWCVALPVLDTLAVMARRMREGKSPFKPDRGHIHHLMLNAGLKPRSALALLVASAVALAFIGRFTSQFTPGSNLLAFGALAVIYVVAHGRIWQHQLSRAAVPATAPALILSMESRVNLRVPSDTAFRGYERRGRVQRSADGSRDQ